MDVAEDGKPVFLTDIYKYDRDFYEKNLPPKVTSRWGSSVLEAPLGSKVPENIVEDLAPVVSLPPTTTSLRGLSFSSRGLGRPL